jgi:diguanylate cyclase (GGDEF)-like protein
MLPEINLATVLLLHETSLLVGALAFLYLRKQLVSTKGLGLLAIAFIALAVGATIAGLGENVSLPYWLWTHLSLFLGTLGYALFWAGLSELSGRRGWQKNKLVLLVPVCLTLIGWMTDFPGQNVLRASVFHINAVIFLMLASLKVRRDYRNEALPVRRLLAAALLLSALVYAINLISLVSGTIFIFSIAEMFLMQILLNFGIALLTVILVNERTERHLKLMAQTDQLTGIGNRRWFLDQLPENICQDMAVIIMDLDHFKQINDRFGHAVGDLVLVEFSRHVSGTLRERDAFARYGGEEFVLFFPQVSVPELTAIGKRLCKEVESLTVMSQNSRVAMTVSMGAAFATGKDDTWNQILHRADLALYAAKKAGRNRFLIAESIYE